MIGDETRKHGSKNDASWARSWRCQLGIGVANSTTQGKLGPGGNQGKKLALPTWDWRCQLHNTRQAWPWRQPRQEVGVANLGLALPTPQHKASLALEATKARSWRCQLGIGVANATDNHTKQAWQPWKQGWRCQL
ncbi:uncharacterized protein DS421_3g94340 [Arachis hypogaea]|nr:uncharacterized protein DS421_3g94340 [Arachis hypogaea]